MSKYKVTSLSGDTWQVVSKQKRTIHHDDIESGNQWDEVYYSEDNTATVYQGSLADCEAYLRLKENGYM